MNIFFRLLLGIIAGVVLALGQFSVALANGGHLHVGTMAIPVIVLWVGGGLLGILFLLFFISWSLSNRAKRRSQGEEKERDPQKAKEKR